MNNLNKAIAQTIAKLRHEANISQEELADRAGIHRTYVSQIERSLKSPTLHVFMQIAKALNTSASEIIKEIETYELQN
jgi:transcriptional regulator with XRE-family HTH domain